MKNLKILLFCEGLAHICKGKISQQILDILSNCAEFGIKPEILDSLMKDLEIIRPPGKKIVQTTQNSLDLLADYQIKLHSPAHPILFPTRDPYFSVKKTKNHKKGQYYVYLFDNMHCGSYLGLKQSIYWL